MHEAKNCISVARVPLYCRDLSCLPQFNRFVFLLPVLPVVYLEGSASGAIPDQNSTLHKIDMQRNSMCLILLLPCSHPTLDTSDWPCTTHGSCQRHKSSVGPDLLISYGSYPNQACWAMNSMGAQPDQCLAPRRSHCKGWKFFGLCWGFVVPWQSVRRQKSSISSLSDVIQTGTRYGCIGSAPKWPCLPPRPPKRQRKPLSTVTRSCQLAKPLSIAKEPTTPRPNQRTRPLNPWYILGIWNKPAVLYCTFCNNPKQWCDGHGE